MSKKNHGLAVEATQGSSEAKKYAEKTSSNTTRSTVGYMIRMFGYAMVLVYSGLFVIMMFLSYGLIL